MSGRGCLAVVLAGAALLAAAGCGTDESAASRHKAEQLVAATHAAGVGANVTVDTAEALYGTSAPAVCKLFNGSGDALNLIASPGGGHYKVFTTHAVAYGRAVVEVYCPQHLAEFNKVVGELEVDKATR
jgi:hypothetical protein